MKLLIFGAAGLLLSTSALAAVGASNKDMVATPTQATVTVSKNAPSLAAVPIGNAILIDHPAKSASTDSAAASDAKTFTAGDSKASGELAAAEIPSTTAMTDATKDMQGVGGPDEAEAVAAVATPQASYPPCSPGPGDDNCIQLYEPGVRASYAAWQAGHVPGVVQTGMGGPDEPVADTGAMPAATADDYPPCRSRSDDRCIQLGEHETLASVSTGEQLAMGGPEEIDAAVEPASAETHDLAAYDEPLPEDLVLPASEGRSGNQPSRSSNGTMAI